MAYNNIAQPRELYFQHGRYPGSKLEDASYDLLLQWPSKGCFDRFKPDAALLRESLDSYPSQQGSTLAEQIFGNQARQQTSTYPQVLRRVSPVLSNLCNARPGVPIPSTL